MHGAKRVQRCRSHFDDVFTRQHTHDGKSTAGVGGCREPGARKGRRGTRDRHARKRVQHGAGEYERWSRPECVCSTHGQRQLAARHTDLRNLTLNAAERLRAHDLGDDGHANAPPRDGPRAVAHPGELHRGPGLLFLFGRNIHKADLGTAQLGRGAIEPERAPYLGNPAAAGCGFEFDANVAAVARTREAKAVILHEGARREHVEAGCVIDHADAIVHDVADATQAVGRECQPRLRDEVGLHGRCLLQRAPPPRIERAFVQHCRRRNVSGASGDLRRRECRTHLLPHGPRGGRRVGGHPAGGLSSDAHRVERERHSGERDTLGQLRAAVESHGRRDCRPKPDAQRANAVCARPRGEQPELATLVRQCARGHDGGAVEEL